MSTTTKIIPIRWNLAQIWNEAAMKENRQLQKRDYVYASEVGHPFIDRYLKMKAVPYTNPPNDRSLRKFLAGNIWEHVTKQILIACGVYRKEEIKIDANPYPNTLSVHGRCDFISGGFVDEELAIRNISALNLPDFLITVANKIIASLAGKTLEEKILELKAVSTFAMDKVERIQMPLPSHSLQGYHYQRNAKMQAAVAYICKDDCRMAQHDVNAAVIEPIYKADLEQMTEYFTKNKKPPKDPLAMFDNNIGKFSKNLGVEWSPYLTKVYGFETPEQYREAVKFVDRWNRTLVRYVMAETGKTTPTGKPISITSKNEEVKKEIEKSGYKMKELIATHIEVGVSSEELEEA